VSTYFVIEKESSAKILSRLKGKKMSDDDYIAEGFERNAGKCGRAEKLRFGVTRMLFFSLFDFAQAAEN
jgi:hypothetical protein